MVAKIAANGSDQRGQRHNRDADSGTSRRRRLLPISAACVAVLYGGTLAWLLLSDSRFAGEPVIRIALAPEEAPAPPETGETDPPPGTGEPDASAMAKEAETAAKTPGQDGLSPDERALLEAARDLDQGIDEDIAAQVKIVGAESVSGGEDDNDTGTAAETPLITLAPIPDPALIESAPQGPLPKIARDGRKPWQVYARPLPADTPADRRIALVVSGMGISESATAHAIEVLPPEVTLSFAPYGGSLQSWIGKARDAGHEVLLELPMEPFGYPQNDPGPYTLLTTLEPSENMARLDWLMSRFTGYAGVMNYQGARFTASATALKPVMSTLVSRGLLYVDNGASARSLAPQLADDLNMVSVQATRIVDRMQSPEVIATSLDLLEQTSRETGRAIGVASGFPVTVDALAQWTSALKSEGYTLVPVTALAEEK
tara:strand:- start:5421 stop:6710 length:1290 start_codon:yes stop_codon:yes gene_type:complete